MQPLNTSDSPSSSITKGWAPASVGSITMRRRCPKPTGPRTKIPDPSGPRRAIVSVMACRRRSDALLSEKKISPQMPHMREGSFQYFQ